MVEEVTTEQIRQFLNQRRAARSGSTLNLERKILSILQREPNPRNIGPKSLAYRWGASCKHAQFSLHTMRSYAIGVLGRVQQLQLPKLCTNHPAENSIGPNSPSRSCCSEAA